jgi:hypothetical protein
MSIPLLDHIAAHGSDQPPAHRKVRPAEVAGSFYPADPAALVSMMDAMLDHAAVAPIEGILLAIVAPHAGYEYSGPVAAHAYAALKGRRYDRVVVIAPSHFEAFSFTSVYDGDAYATPLGTIPVDKEFAKQLASASSSIHLSGRGHDATARGGEHALEVQLPWLQRVLGEFSLVPVVMGDHSYSTCRTLGIALAKLIQETSGESTLIVASSDLSHYHPYDDAIRLDRNTLQGIRERDYFSLARNIDEHVWEACGAAPIAAAMMAAERLDANRAELLHYANSGDTGGGHDRVVGYGAVAFVKGAAPRAEVEFSLGEEEKSHLLSLARTAVEYTAHTQKLYEPAPVLEGPLSHERGAFVTLKANGSLRGCIGYSSPVKPLYLTVRDTATMAAFRDPRFTPVSLAELPSLEYEISVLSPLRRVRSIDEIHIGRDGLMVKCGSQEGLLLPQVALEHSLNAASFLRHTCTKAGLPPDAWKSEATDVFSFSALVFSSRAVATEAPHPAREA